MKDRPSDPAKWGINNPRAVEVVSMRQPGAKHFSSGPGQMTAVFSPGMHSLLDGELVDASPIWVGDDKSARGSAGMLHIMVNENGVHAELGQYSLLWLMEGAHSISEDERTLNKGGWDWSLGLGLKASQVVVETRGPRKYSLPYLSSHHVKILDNGAAAVGDLLIPRPVIMLNSGRMINASAWEDDTNELAFHFDDTELTAEDFPYIIDPSLSAGAVDADMATVGMSNAACPPTTPYATFTGFYCFLGRRYFYSDTNNVMWQHALIRWDTSSIPDDAVIAACSFVIRPTEIKDDSQLRLTGEWASWYPAANADYKADLADTMFTDPPDVRNMNEGEFTYIACKNLTSINKTGYTEAKINYLDARCEVDAGNDIMNYMNLNQLTHPTLIIDYVLPGVPKSTPLVYSPAEPGAPRRKVNWDIVLCDRKGVPISRISPIARDRKMSVGLGRPSSLTFTVPSNDPMIGGLHGDGRPRLDMLRVVKAYREETIDGAVQKTIRFAGYVWIMEDVGDGDSTWTTVVCYDPMQVLAHRYMLTKVLSDVDAGLVARLIVGDANALGDTGIVLDGAFDACNPVSVNWSGKSVGEALVELMEAGYYEFGFVPFEQDPPNGGLVQMGLLRLIGGFQDKIQFGYGVPPFNIGSINQLNDASNTSNVVIGMGGDPQNYAVAVDQPAVKSTGLRLESLQQWPDVTNYPLVNRLTAEYFNARRAGIATLQIVPEPGRCPEPFTQLRPGDTYTVSAMDALRGGFSSVVRVYGFDFDIRDDGAEVVTSIIIARDQASATLRGPGVEGQSSLSTAAPVQPAQPSDEGRLADLESQIKKLGTHQGVEIRDEGVVIGTRNALNLHQGAGISVVAADDSASGEVDITISANGGVDMNWVIDTSAASRVIGDTVSGSLGNGTIVRYSAYSFYNDVDFLPAIVTVQYQYVVGSSTTVPTGVLSVAGALPYTPPDNADTYGPLGTWVADEDGTGTTKLSGVVVYQTSGAKLRFMKSDGTLLDGTTDIQFTSGGYLHFNLTYLFGLQSGE